MRPSAGAGGTVTPGSSEAVAGWRGAPVRVPLAAALLPAGIALAVVYAVPLASLVVDSLKVGGHLSLERYLRLLETPVFATVVWRTLRISALVTVLCGLLGYPLAYALVRLPARFAAPLLLLVTVPFFTSVLIRSYAWVVILGQNGLVNRVLLWSGLTSEPLRLVHNELGVFIGMVQIQLPLMVLPVYSIMRRIDRSLVAAARSLGAPPASAFWNVFVPLSAPGVAAGASLVFVSCLGFYVTPALLGGPGEYLIAQSIDARVTTLVDFGSAAAQATVLLAAVVGLMLALRGPLGLSLQVSDERGDVHPGGARLGGRLRVVAGMCRRLRRPEALEAVWGGASSLVADLISAVRKPVLAVLASLTLLLLVLPMVVVVPLAFSDAPYLTFPPPGYSLRWFVSYLRDRAWTDATGFSLLVSVLSAGAATALGTLAAFPLVRVRVRASSLVYLLYVSPMIVPHMVIAVALFFVMAPAGLVGHPLGFVSAYTVLGVPYVLIVMTAALRRFDRSLEQAAASLGASPARVTASVTLPLLRTAIGTAFLFAFLAAFDDVVVALFLSSPEAVTLPIRMWEDIRQEISPRIAAVAVLFFGIMVCLVFVPRLVRRLRTPRGAPQRTVGEGTPA